MAMLQKNVDNFNIYIILTAKQSITIDIINNSQAVYGLRLNIFK